MRMWLAPWLLLALVGILPEQAAAAALPNCPGSPLILTEPDSEALDTILALWARYQSGTCYGRIVMAAPGTYRLQILVRLKGYNWLPNRRLLLCISDDPRLLIDPSPKRPIGCSSGAKRRTPGLGSHRARRGAAAALWVGHSPRALGHARAHPQCTFAIESTACLLHFSRDSVH